MSVEGKSAPCMSEKIGPDGDENYVYYSPSAEYPGHVKVKLHLLYYNVRMKTDAFYLIVAVCIRWNETGRSLYKPIKAHFSCDLGMFQSGLYKDFQHYGRNYSFPISEGKNTILRTLGCKVFHRCQPVIFGA